MSAFSSVVDEKDLLHNVKLEGKQIKWLMKTMKITFIL